MLLLLLLLVMRRRMRSRRRCLLLLLRVLVVLLLLPAGRHRCRRCRGAGGHVLLRCPSRVKAHHDGLGAGDGEGKRVRPVAQLLVMHKVASCAVRARAEEPKVLATKSLELGVSGRLP